MARTKNSAGKRKQKAISQTQKSHWKKLWSSIPSASVLCLRFCSYWRDIFHECTSYFTDLRFLTYEQHNFLLEYGPAVRDGFIRLPGVSYMRSFCRWAQRSSHSPEKATPILDLPDELLLLICGHLEPQCRYCGGCAHQHQHPRDLNSLSKANRRLRQATSSLLFGDLGIKCGWSRARRALDTIAASPQIQREIKTFRLDLDIRPGMQWMPMTPLTPKLVSVLPLLPRLHTVHLRLYQQYARPLKMELERTSLQLPTVRCLVLGPGMWPLVAHCPAVESVTNLGWRWSRYDEESPDYDEDGLPRDVVALVRAAGSAGMVRRLSLDAGWDDSLLRRIHCSLPSLESLTVRGSIGFEAQPRDLIPALRAFKRLRELDLPPISRLNVGYQGMGICGTPYAGPGGEKLLERDERRWAKERRAIGRSIAEMVFHEMPGVEKLWFYGTMLFTPAHRTDGSLHYVRYEDGARKESTTLGY